MVCNKKRKPVFIKWKWNHVVFSRATILSFHPVLINLSISMWFFGCLNSYVTFCTNIYLLCSIFFPSYRYGAKVCNGDTTSYLMCNTQVSNVQSSQFPVSWAWILNFIRWWGFSSRILESEEYTLTAIIPRLILVWFGLVSLFLMAYQPFLGYLMPKLFS